MTVEPDPGFSLTEDLLEALRRRSVSRNPARRAASAAGGRIRAAHLSPEARRAQARRAAIIGSLYREVLGGQQEEGQRV